MEVFTLESSQKLFIRALKGETLARPPFWLMRQAGRYLPEYRATRAQAGSFLDLCFAPELAVEVTLQPREKTLTDAEIEGVASKIVTAVTKATGGELRG